MVDLSHIVNACYTPLMAYFFLDDSKHHGRGFSLSAFAICETDPQHELTSLFVEKGFDPSKFEFKSSNQMQDNSSLQELRSRLREFIRHKCRVAVCIVTGDKNIGPASLRLLENAITHDSLQGQQHEVFFDEGLFSPKSAGNKLAAELECFEQCQFHFEQDSKTVAGIQVADLAAHTSGIMLLDALGHINKKVRIQDSGYDNEIELGFEMWAGIRHAFLHANKTHPKDDFDHAIVEVEPYGLRVDESVEQAVANAARKRFGEMYIGCIH
ncbi:MAG: DUF3800 domain-containing protein [Rhizobiaceae bacterium]